MTPEREPRGTGLFLLIGAVVLLMLLVTAVILPLWTCPDCELLHSTSTILFRRPPSCTGCGGSGKVNLFTRWKLIRDLRANGIEGIPLLR